MSDSADFNQFEKAYGVSPSRYSLLAPRTPFPTHLAVTPFALQGGSDITAPRFFTPPNNVPQPYSAAFLAAVSSQRPDIFYSEIYKNLFYSRRFASNGNPFNALKPPHHNYRPAKDSEAKTYLDEQHPEIGIHIRSNNSRTEIFKQSSTSPLHGLAVKSPVKKYPSASNDLLHNSFLPHSTSGVKQFSSHKNYYSQICRMNMENNSVNKLDNSVKIQSLEKARESPKQSNGNGDMTNGGQINHYSSSRPSSVDSPDFPTDLVNENRFRRRKRKLADTCPVCGVTVREHEFQQHFEHELLRLQKISQETLRNTRRTSYDRERKIANAIPTSSQHHASVTPTTSKKHEQEGTKTMEKENRLKTFQKVRMNRIERLNARVGRSMRGQLAMKSQMNFPQNIYSQLSASLPNDLTCPLCAHSLAHLPNYEDVAAHVANCGSSSPASDRHSSPERNFEEYVWCGQTRIRATALAGNDVIRNSPGCQVITKIQDESDEDLNVDVDETTEFGPEQFRDSDLLKDGDVLSTDQSKSLANNEADDIPSALNNCSDSNAIILALRLKLKEFENEGKGNRCLICMEPHTKPLVSVQCWHVHCEKCWLRALGVKKVCPQCNMITPASLLRTIYL